VPLVQLVPLAWPADPHIPPLQVAPLAQSVLVLQLVRQPVPIVLQMRLPAQGLVETAGHAPAPLHPAAAVSVEPEQL
jgi:hypothetical protein